jgi:hypothetical protein
LLLIIVLGKNKTQGVLCIRKSVWKNKYTNLTIFHDPNYAGDTKRQAELEKVKQTSSYGPDLEAALGKELGICS